jgi:hypothetical protein
MNPGKKVRRSVRNSIGMNEHVEERLWERISDSTWPPDNRVDPNLEFIIRDSLCVWCGYRPPHQFETTEELLDFFP